jgi:hypothetical protein
MMRKTQAILGMTLALVLLAGTARAQLNEKALLLNSPDFGNFQDAKKSKEKGQATLQVWQSYGEFLRKRSSLIKPLMLQGPAQVTVTYDGIWTAERDHNPIMMVQRERHGEPFRVKLYWLKNQAQAFVVEKYCKSDPLTWEKLDKPGYRIIALVDRKAILPELSKLAAHRQAFAALTPAAHLQAAEKALAAGNPNEKEIQKRTYGRLDEARRHLEAFDRKSKELAETAKKLMAEVDRREKDLKKYKEVMRKAAQEEMIKKRENMVKELDRDFLNKGFDVHFQLSGSDKTVLKMDCVLFSRPLVFVFVDKTDMLQKLRDAGFEEVVFSNKKIKYEWDIDLNG